MHKDRPPGFFDFAERSVRYLVGFWFTTGLVLSVIAHTGILVWRDNAKPGPERNPDALEAAANARKPASAKTPPPSAVVRY
jgi:hypothetical protein